MEASRIGSKHNIITVQNTLQEKLWRRPLATIERLPQEIIEEIFLGSCNFSLPLASPTIAAQLSCSYVYKQFLTRVFGVVQYGTRKCLHGHTILRTTPGLQETRETLEEMQDRALRCRWLTWEIFKPHLTRMLDKNVTVAGDVPHLWIHQRDCVMLFIGTKFLLPNRLLQQPFEISNFEFLRILIKAVRRARSEIIHGNSEIGHSWPNDSYCIFDIPLWQNMWFQAVRSKDYRFMHLILLRRGGVHDGCHTLGEDFVEKTMKECRNDLAAAHLLGYWLFGRRWISLKVGTMPITSSRPEIVPLLEAFQEKREKLYAPDLLKRLTAQYPGDEEWFEDVKDIIWFIDEETLMGSVARRD